MRNLTSKSNFSRPNTANSFKKSDRKYDQPKKVQRSTGQSNQMIPQVKNFTSPTLMPMKTQPIITTAMSTFKYHFSVQNPFPIQDRNSQQQYFQQTCLWFKNLNRSTSNKKKYVKFGRTQYVLSNWVGDSFPNVIYVCADGFVGYFDVNGIVTDRLAALQLSQISLILDQNSLRTYELRYVLPLGIKWQIPSELTHLKFSIKLQDQQQALLLPLPNPMTIQLQIGQE